MQIVPATHLLTPAGLAEPSLRILIPTQDNYTTLLLQPQGNIDADANGVRHADHDLAQKQFRAFLDDAVRLNADLAVTPEYSMPWDTLAEAIKASVVPSPGKLWALGCESIKYAELVRMKESLADHATLLFEPLDPDARRFLDPLAYVFVAPSVNPDTPSRLVVLVQFKTFPMGDDDHFEINGLQLGTCIYYFGNAANLRLVSIICSDAFAFEDSHARAIYNCTLVLHIQLNSQPRQEQYRLYRNKLFSFGGNRTELICLNWAKNVSLRYKGVSECWNNIAGSAWYLQPDKYDDSDETLTLNHQRGLYYTWSNTLRSHVLFLNYNAASYFVTATKVAHIGVSASLSRRIGPKLEVIHVWDQASLSWLPQATSEDGFSAVVTQTGNAQRDIATLAAHNPFSTERVLALTAGEFGTSDTWHIPRKLDSCGIEATEVIRRMTYCQDTDSQACLFRTARLRRCMFLDEILKAGGLPVALSDLATGFCFDWVSTSPHQNVLSHARRRATVIYLGEGYTDDQAEAVAKRISEYLWRHFSNPDEIMEARHRLQVWYRNSAAQITLWDSSGYRRFDIGRSGSEFDIARET